MKTKNKENNGIETRIELWGWLGTISIFSSVWIDVIRWKLFLTGVFFLIGAIVEYLVLEDRKKKKQEVKDE